MTSSASQDRRPASARRKELSGSFSARLAVLGVLCAVASAPWAAAEPLLVDRVLVGIDASDLGAGQGDVITASDVDVVARLSLMERDRGADGVPTQALRRAIMDEIIAEILVYREAARLALAEVSPEELLRARRDLVGRLGGEAALATFLREARLGSGELEALLRRRIVVQRFIETNVRSTVEVSEADVEAAHAAGDHPFGDRPLGEVREAIRTYLAELRFRAAVGRWVRALRERSRIRVLER